MDTLDQYQIQMSYLLKGKLAQAALHAPPKVVFAMRSWPFLLPSFSLSLFLRLLLLTNFRESPVCEDLFPPIFWHN